MKRDHNALLEGLKALGINEGDALLVHSSYKSLGGVDGGIDTVISALKSAVGDSGTLIMPTFTYEYVNASSPVFDVSETPSCVGMITELFRKSEGVIRSIHPTHSLAVWGKDKEYYVRDHRLDKTCLEKNSPIFKLKENHGKIMLLGCPTEKLTLLHGAEIAMSVPYAFTADYNDPRYHREYTCVDEKGNKYTQKFYHVFSKAAGYAHDFNKLSDLIELVPKKLLDADCLLFDASELWNTVCEAMKKDPYCLATRIDI
jgi:aminoglycoside 3-N-acetyltransferase